MSNTVEKSAAMQTGENVKVSIIIKTLNEDKNIARCIESALMAIKNVSGEVILADSISTDRTVEIASQYPIKIVQLKNIRDRGCGAGPQLGYQHSVGEFVYILDGDMEFIPGFIEKALERMLQTPELGGVAGIITECGSGNYDFEIRITEHDSWRRPGTHPWLDMGGLYRRRAIESVGYFSNKNLNAFEEQELGTRLSHNGWLLERIDVPSVIHYGHTMNTFELTRRRWRSGYLDGSGELVRNALGKPYFRQVIKTRLSYIAMTCVFVFVALSVFLIPWQVEFFIFSVIAVMAMITAMIVRKKSVRLGLMGFSLWPVKVIAFIRGFVRKPANPEVEIPSITIANNTEK